MGTELPDNGGHPLGIGDQTLHHVYYSDSGLVTDDAAAIRAEEEYQVALTAFENGDFDDAALHLGSMSHYISDLGVFGHVMGSGTDWGAEVNHANYEGSADTRMDEYPSDGFSGSISGDGLDIIDAYTGALDVAYDTTFDVDGELTCTWMDNHYNWSDAVFEERAGESVNLCVNTISDLLHSFYAEVDPDVVLANFDFYYGYAPCVLVQPSSESTKALGCSQAMVSDWLASAYLHTRLMTCGEGFDTDPFFVDQVTGRLVGVNPVISFGGPIVNPIVKYAEAPSTPLLDRAPVMYVGESGTCNFKLQDGSVIPGASLPSSVVGDNEDMFVVELFTDSLGRVHLLCYGFGWQGTYAAGKYFDKVVYPDLSQYKVSWMVVKWSDTNGDGFVNAPGTGDTYTEIATG